MRARTAAVRALRQARQQLSSFLLRHGHHYRAGLGRSRTGAGLRGSNSSRPCTTSCLRISSPLLRRPGETAWNSTLRRRYQIGRRPLWCTPCNCCAACDWWPRLELADLEPDQFNHNNQGLWARGLLIRRNIADGDQKCFGRALRRCGGAQQLFTFGPARCSQGVTTRPATGGRGSNWPISSQTSSTTTTRVYGHEAC